MQFEAKRLHVPAYAAGVTSWVYKLAEDELLPAVHAPGHFDAAAEMLSQGDLILLTGLDGAVAAYLNWLERCVPLEPAPMRPSFQHDADDCVHALEIMPDGTVWRHERFAPFIVEERSTAIGAGAAYALGAMAAGKSAPEAVVIACELHCGSALPMDSLRLRTE